MDSLELSLRAGGKTGAYTAAEKTAYATKKNANYLALLQNMDASAMLPGIQAFLDDLRAQHYQLALASASKNSPFVLERFGLADYFPALVDPTTLQHGKPDPEIFARGAALLNLPPAACIGVEDARVGVEAINAAGEISIGIGNRQILNEAVINFSDTRQLTVHNIAQALG